jgi:hypothetical protein
VLQSNGSSVCGCFRQRQQNDGRIVLGNFLKWTAITVRVTLEGLTHPGHKVSIEAADRLQELIGELMREKLQVLIEILTQFQP